MSQLALPNLESLEMCYLENVTHILQLLYEQALTRLPLKHLRIESGVFSEIQFVRLLRRLPSLISLELVDMEDVSSSTLRALASPQPWVCPRLETMVLDGCTNIDWDSLRGLVESRLPAHSYPNYQNPEPFRSGNASASASAAARYQRSIVRSSSQMVLRGQQVQRIRSVDVTRCTQISKEMVQWLRMYVSQVKCEPAKGVWGDALMA
ncbi:hypothetical protein MPER_09390 [Moniliophthora perniciosa FA553]|nr:hypothetical protein MPER_09390 [Moniliophthora perniciosa FA553]